MPVKTISKQINGITWSINTMDAMRGLKAQARLAKLFGGALGKTLGELDVAKLSQVFAGVDQMSDSERNAAFAKAIMDQDLDFAAILGELGDRAEVLPDLFELLTPALLKDGLKVQHPAQEFAGQLEVWYQLALWSVMENFAGFFSKLTASAKTPNQDQGGKAES